MTAETIYADSINPKSCCDIGLHLPYLRSIARGKIVELGTRYGASTSAFLLGLRPHIGHLYSVDSNVDCGQLFDEDRWTFIQGHTTNDAARILKQLPIVIDILFVDADHAYESVRGDLVVYGPLVRAGGMILLHDTELEGAGVMGAAQQYAESRGVTLENRTGCNGLGIIRL